MSVPNCGSSTPKSTPLVNSSHSFHWLEAPAPAITAKSRATPTRIQPVRVSVISW